MRSQSLYYFSVHKSAQETFLQNIQEVNRMPTFNQLVRKGRQTTAKKSTAPALQKHLLRRREVFVQQLRLQPRKNLTQLLEKSPEFVFLTESK